MKVDEENRHYTTIKSISRLKRENQACMSLLHVLPQLSQQGISIMSTAVAMVTLRSICPLKKKKMVKI